MALCPTTTRLLPIHLLKRTAQANGNTNLAHLASTALRRHRRPLHIPARLRKWEGSSADEHAARETDKHGVLDDAVKGGKEERARGQESSSTATSEADKLGSNAKAKKEHPEAPGPVLGMNDERGKKGH